MLIAISKMFLLLLVLSITQADDQTASDSPLVTTNVGAPTMLTDMVISGGELVAKPLQGDPEMIVQILEATPHGNSFRYAIRFSGLEPGQHDLADWLVRKEPADDADIEPVLVEIESLLPSGQVTPNELQRAWIPRMGGYRWIVSLLALLWGLILLTLIFVGKKNASAVLQTETRPQTLADLLKQRIEAALEDQDQSEGEGDHQQHAELERMLFSMWRRRLGFESLPIDEAMAKIKSDSEAGPLMTQLENWMHQPSERNQDVDLAKLLQPYRSLSVDELEADE